MKRVLLLVDDWELQERYEELLLPFAQVSCFAFTKDAILCAKTEYFDLIIISLTHDDFTTTEAVTGLLQCKGVLDSAWLIVEPEENHENLQKVLTGKIVTLMTPPCPKDILLEKARHFI